jgi:uncharacterized protein YgiM (DUF1202 family)
VLFEGDEAEATGRDSTSNDWLLIDYDGDDGWVATSVVTVEGDPTTLDIVEDSGGEETVGNTDVTATADDAVNVRIGPGTSYIIVGQLDSGDTVDITGRTPIEYPLVCRGSTVIDAATAEAPENLWLRINFNGFDAWVNYAAVDVSGDLCDAEDAEAEDAEVPEEVEDFINQVLVITLENTNLRASNYASSEVLDVIPYSTSLVAEARDEEGERIRVTYGDETGWISTSFVEVTRGNLDNLPVEEE